MRRFLAGPLGRWPEGQGQALELEVVGSFEALADRLRELDRWLYVKSDLALIHAEDAPSKGKCLQYVAQYEMLRDTREKLHTLCAGLMSFEIL